MKMASLVGTTVLVLVSTSCALESKAPRKMLGMAEGWAFSNLRHNGQLLSRRGRRSPANASGFDTHRDSVFHEILIADG
jgi:hypothetical protein